MQNRFGFWIVTPTLIAATIAFTLGYENSRRPARLIPALFDWPEDARRPATTREYLASDLNALIVTGVTLVLAGAEPTRPVALIPAIAAFAPALAGLLGYTDAQHLRRGVFVFTIGSLANLICLGGHLPGLTVSIGLALGAFADAATKRRLLVFVSAVSLLAAATAASLAYLGVATTYGPVVGFVAALAIPRAHRAQLRLSEWIANSWSSMRIGPVRVINYAIYPFIAAFFGSLIFEAASSGPAEWNVLVIALCGVVGGGLWGQLLEYTGRLARPFGYFGAMLGATIGVLAASALTGVSILAITGAGALAAPWVQAVGRLRCLVQGCCHGRPAGNPHQAIVYRRPQSRVTRIAKLDGVPVYPTPLYSIYGNLLLGILLLRLDLAHMPASLIAGVYLIGAGAARFIEEDFRGEPQTRVIFDLKIYRWLALGEALAGSVLTMFKTAPLAPIHIPSLVQFAAAVAIALIAGMAMGVDFPESRWRFSQLTPK
ncbi:MAG: prolipoprotein diacylglyceryl transferase family protein [Rhizomicrobium sp.]